MRKTTRTITHWGTYDIEVIDDTVASARPVADDLDPSPIGESLVNTLNDACRITQPMVRAGYLEEGGGSRERRGMEPFVAVSWDKAEQLVANELDRVRKEHGNEAIFGGSYGWASAGRFHHAQSQIHRFLNCIGGYTRSVDTYSLAAAEVILPHVIGQSWAYITAPTSWPSVIRNAELFVAFGGIPLKNAQISSGGVRRHTQREYMKEAKNAAVEFVNIGPLKGDTPEFLNAQWLAPRPNTDVAIMLGIAHTLVVENLYNREFIDKYSVGFEPFLKYLKGDTDEQPKDADWAAAISGIDAVAIRELARKMAAKRTMISLSWSLSRQEHGEQPYWMGVTLAAMLGQLGLPGCGIGFGYSAENKIGTPEADVRLGSVPAGDNKVSAFIPVARIADMLLHPGEEFQYNGGSYIYPDIELVYWAGGNPFHHHQDLNRLRRAWRKPSTVICNEIWWNSTAKHADIVLPCTSPLERNDIGGASGGTALLAMHQACTPTGQAKSDFDIFSGISAKLGTEQTFTAGLDEMGWIRKLYRLTQEFAKEQAVELPSFEDFWSTGEFEFTPPASDHCMMSDFRKSPEDDPLNTPSGKIEIFSSTIDSYGYLDCPGHPVWIPPTEWLGNKIADKFPYHLTSNQPTTRLHSQLDNGVTSQKSKVASREPLMIHPGDAAKKGLSNGDVVRVFNARGALLAGVVVSENVRQGVLQMATGAWWDPAEWGETREICKHGNVNVLTMDKGTSQLAQGPSALSCLVDIERLETTPPEVSAYSPPEIF